MVASAADAGIHKKIIGLGNNPSYATLIISNDKTEGVIKIVKYLEDSRYTRCKLTVKYFNRWRIK